MKELIKIYLTYKGVKIIIGWVLVFIILYICYKKGLIQFYFNFFKDLMQ